MLNDKHMGKLICGSIDSTTDHEDPAVASAEFEDVADLAVEAVESAAQDDEKGNAASSTAFASPLLQVNELVAIDIAIVTPLEEAVVANAEGPLAQPRTKSAIPTDAGDSSINTAEESHTVMDPAI
jgi:hypothetical protein